MYYTTDIYDFKGHNCKQMGWKITLTESPSPLLEIAFTMHHTTYIQNFKNLGDQDEQ